MQKYTELYINTYNNILNSNTYNPNKQYLLVSTDVVDSILTVFSTINNNDVDKTKYEIIDIAKSVIDVGRLLEDKELEVEGLELYSCLEDLLYSE